MRAMLLESPASIAGAPLRLAEVPIPEPGPGEIRIAVGCCGICRTDLHVVEGDLPRAKLPVIPGHQVVGRVEALGARCRGTFHIGQRVGIAWLRETCGVCAFCRRHQENLCASARFTGYHSDGGYAELAVIGEEYAYAIPEILSDDEAAPLLCAGIIGYRAWKRSAPKEGGTIGLFGFGSSAHIVLQIAKEEGCRVFVVTRGERHRQLALAMGAEWAHATVEGMPAKLDSAILFAPAGELVPPALSALAKGGTLALAGISMSAIPALDYERHLFYEKNLLSVTANTRDDGRELFALVATGKIRPLTTRYDLESANQALQDLKADKIAGSGVLIVGEGGGRLA